MRAYLKVDPRLRFLKLSMMAADCDSMTTFSFLLVDFFQGMNEWLSSIYNQGDRLQVEMDLGAVNVSRERPGAGEGGSG